MEAKHTPGPWRDGPLFGRTTRGIFWTDTSKPGKWQRRVDEKGEFSAEDARLIAASPDLLLELQRAVEMLEEANRKGASQIVPSSMRAAINKATGSDS